MTLVDFWKQVKKKISEFGRNKVIEDHLQKDLQVLESVVDENIKIFGGEISVTALTGLKASTAKLFNTMRNRQGKSTPEEHSLFIVSTAQEREAAGIYAEGLQELLDKLDNPDDCNKLFALSYSWGFATMLQSTVPGQMKGPIAKDLSLIKEAIAKFDAQDSDIDGKLPEASDKTGASFGKWVLLMYGPDMKKPDGAAEPSETSTPGCVLQ